MRDAVLAGVLVGLALVPGVRSVGLLLGALPVRPLDTLGMLLVLGQGLPLVLRRRKPALTLGLAGLSVAVYAVLGYPSVPTSVGLLIALYSAGAYLERRRREVALLAAGGFVCVVLMLRAAAAGSAEPQPSVLDYGIGFAGLAAFWVLGAWVRTRGAVEKERRQRQAHDAVTQERARIARELHDVVTHHVTSMVVQADAAALVPGTPEPTTAALDRIATAGRQAMTELRHQLGTLQEVEPQVHGAEEGRVPVPGRLRDLVEVAAEGGQVVQLHEEGDRGQLGDGIQLAVYRIVQESLTNARKHAPNASTDVLVRCTSAEVTVEVRTHPELPGAAAAGGTGRASPRTEGRTSPRSWPGPGRGLIGMRERAAAVGGRLDAVPVEGGGFRVTARIPAGAGRG